MQEKLLHFIWQNKLFNTKKLKTTEGSDIQILNFGKLNKDGGPDFFQASIKIENIILVGNIELHVYASDWWKHGHQQDKKYQNVILHVVFINDINDIPIPTLELNGLIPTVLLHKYQSMMNNQEVLICQNLLQETDNFTVKNWQERLVIERLERKSNDILSLFKRNNNDWEKVCYQLLGKYFGSHINQHPFELLTQLLDYKILLKHLDNEFQIEALLFGVAGFLNKDFVEIYPRNLKQEYICLKHKYNLKEVDEHLWQWLRLRPISFPTIRLAWFAVFLQQFPFLQNILDNNKIHQMLDKIDVTTYWNHHYLFDKQSKFTYKKIGNEFKTILKVNVFAPVLFAYGRYSDNMVFINNAIDLLLNTAPEHNSKMKVFDEINWKINSAFHTQALLEQHDNYCIKKRCLECGIGHRILRKQNDTDFSNIH